MGNSAYSFIGYLLFFSFLAVGNRYVEIETNGITLNNG
jgi:hypothetical protein